MKTEKNESIITLLSDFFGIEDSIMQEYYLNIEKSYNLKTGNSYDGFLSVDKFPNIQFESNKILENWKNSTLIGLDLPLFFNSNNYNGKTIAIVGIDPLRKRKDFPNFKSGDVIIGTPYAFHSTFYRESKGRTKAYYDFVEHIVSKGYNVYVTDVFKIWMNDFGKNESNKFFLGEEASSFKILYDEINIIKPKIIIAFGNLAEEILEKLEISTTIVKFPHPSGANRNWNTIIKGKATCDEKVNYLCSEFDKKIKNL